MDTTAVIQFIGIVLFSASIPDDPGVHALLPRIGHVHRSDLHDIMPVAKGNEQKALAQISETGIENHVSVLMYRSADRLAESNWKRDGALANKWNYVVLNGEHVQFSSNGAKNAKPQIPLNLPRTAASDSCNVTRQALRPGFLPPTYKDAAAVVDIEEGRLSNCRFKSRQAGDRLDTRLILNTKDKLVIRATKKFTAPKTLVLKPNAVVYVANIPPYALMIDTDLTLGAPHWEAYNKMLTGPCAVAPEVVGDLALLTTEVPSCDLEGLTSFQTARQLPPMDFQMIDSECSNTQWP